MTDASPTDRLRAAADLIEQRAAAAPPDAWALAHVRATLVPWVALMAPDLAPHLAALLREAADGIDRYLSPLAAAAWHRELALADVLLRGETR